MFKIHSLDCIDVNLVKEARDNNIKVHDSIVRDIINKIDRKSDSYYPYKMGIIKKMAICKSIYGFYTMTSDLMPIKSLDKIDSQEVYRLDEVDGWWYISIVTIGVLPIVLYNTEDTIQLEELLLDISTNNPHSDINILEPILTGFLNLNKDVYIGEYNLSENYYELDFGKRGVSVNGKMFTYNREECNVFNTIKYQTKRI